jgi:hypothetical protein
MATNFKHWLDMLTPSHLSTLYSKGRCNECVARYDCGRRPDDPKSTIGCLKAFLAWADQDHDLHTDYVNQINGVRLRGASKEDCDD